MYDQLLFTFGHLQAACPSLWPADFHPWAAIFLADYLRGFMTEPVFLQMFPQVSSDYLSLAQCIVENTK